MTTLLLVGYFTRTILQLPEQDEERAEYEEKFVLGPLTVGFT